MGHSEELSGIRHSLLEDGFAVVPQVLDAATLALIDHAVDRSVAAAPEAHFERNKTTGSMLPVGDEPEFATLVAWPRTLEILRGLGFGEVAWQSGYVIRKPGGGPRLFWHQDWLFWDQPVSHELTPHQIFAMYYLVDTRRENGCLRVIPGSHRQHLPAHDQLARAHSPEALAGADAGHPMFADLPGERDVPVKAGDLLLGDSRLLHAAHANLTENPRTLVTLWYHPAYQHLPQPIQGWIADNHGGALADWPVAARNRVSCALPYRTSADPPAPVNREPAFAA